MNPAWGVEIPGGWYNDATHCYRNEQGIEVPSVTQIFDLLHLTDLSAIPQATLEWKREFGNSVHRSVQLLVEGDLDWDSCDERAIPAIVGIEQRLKQMQFVSHAREENRVYTLCGMRYGGTLDHRGICIYQGKERHCVIDLKTADRESPTWKWQVSAYSVGLDKVPGGWLGIVLKVGRDGDVTPYYYDVFSGIREFQCLLAACILGINTRLYKLGKCATM